MFQASAAVYNGGLPSSATLRGVISVAGYRRHGEKVIRFVWPVLASSCLSVRIEQIDSQLKDFYEA